MFLTKIHLEIFFSLPPPHEGDYNHQYPRGTSWIFWTVH